MSVTHSDPQAVGEPRPSPEGGVLLASRARAAATPRRKPLGSPAQTSSAGVATVAQLDRVPLSQGGDPGSTPGGRSPLLASPSPALATPREREIVTLLANGQSAKLAAAALGLSAKTVETHVANVMRKLRVHNRAGLTLWAVRAGLVTA